MLGVMQPWSRHGRRVVLASRAAQGCALRPIDESTTEAVTTSRVRLGTKAEADELAVGRVLLVRERPADSSLQPADDESPEDDLGCAVTSPEPSRRPPDEVDPKGRRRLAGGSRNAGAQIRI